ncbi:hypothetical protein BH23GEM7_BH23GEM7_20390 [soil metagenome]
MRQLQVQIRRDKTDRVLELAREHESLSPNAVRAQGSDGEEFTLVFLNLPNSNVGRFVEAVRKEVEQAQFVLLPLGTLPLQTPLEEIEESVTDVSSLSTLELVLGSLQSIGSWKGILLYSALAGLIGAYGVIFDVSYLLVAAMLINPMGAPAIVSVIALAIGDVRMFGRGGLRFLISLAVQAGAALALGAAYALDISTPMMEQITSLSSWSVLVALAAGAAGAVTQVKSERDSLVSGTAAGFMVAAALAPPAAVLGLSIPLGRWDYTALMGFLLLLQFVAIGVGGWLALMVYGVHPADPSVGRGKRMWRTVLAALVLLATAGMVWWQMGQEPRFLKADLSRQALHLVRDAVATIPEARLIASTAGFTRREIEPRDHEALLIEVVVEDTAGTRNSQELESAVRASVTREVAARMERVIPFVNVTVLPGNRSP